MSKVLERFRLDGRSAIVSGIGPGVGEHVAKAYAEMGANVVCAARTADKVERVAPGHCTGEPEFAALKKAFGDHYVYAGAGTVIELSRAQVASQTSSAGR